LISMAVPGGPLRVEVVQLTRWPIRQPGAAVLFGLSRPLGPAETVVEAGGTRPHQHRIKRSLKALGRRAWVFSEDLDYGAELNHPTRLLLVDDRTGRAGRPIMFSS
jgi:hypothetical protein